MRRRWLAIASFVVLMTCASQAAWSQEPDDSGPSYLNVFGDLEAAPEFGNVPVVKAEAPERVATEPPAAAPDVAIDSAIVSTPDHASPDALASDPDALASEQLLYPASSSLNNSSLDLEGNYGAAGPKCDCKKYNALAKAAAGSHKVVFWNNNFDYLCDECYDGRLLGDDWKRMCVGRNSVLDVGGSFRLRYHNEHNHRGLGLTGRDDSFLLTQIRLYANLEMGDSIRVYAEMIDAGSSGENFNARPIEEDRTDLLNLFIDVELWSDCCGTLTGRVGRQELIFGAQRLVSPLPWGNTRRTFEGASLKWKGELWDVDAFWTRPVSNHTATFNSPDQSREFMGVYSTYKGVENETLNLYFLRFIEDSGPGFHYNTIGTRWQGSRCDWLWETEVAGQYGDVGTTAQAAWAYTLGLGRKLPFMPCWKPTFWAYFDFASGDDRGNGFHHQFPLGHKYLGFMDLFGRRNIEDLNFQFSVKPTDKLKLLA